MIVYVQINDTDEKAIECAKQIQQYADHHDVSLTIDVTETEGCSLWIVPLEEWVKEHE